MALGRVSRIAVALMTAAILAAPAPAAAADNDYGEMVDYELTFPLDGPFRLSDTFYARRSHGDHHAQDLMADKMVPVLAAANGTIRYVNWSSRNTNPDRCCSIVLTHDDGWESRYLHLNNDTPGTDDGKGWGIAADLVPGSRVKAGEVIGWVGDSGNAENTPPHLHFQLHDDAGTIVNPYEALRAAEERRAAADDPLFDGERVLRKGSRGDDVRRLQEVVALFGIDPGPIDGIFGAQTDTAVRSFQESAGIEADGLVGSGTRQALATRLLATRTVVRRGDRGEAVGLVQDLLHAAGYDPGPVDGIFGGLTHDAVAAFQRDRELKVDGVVGPQTWGRLFGSQ